MSKSKKSLARGQVVQSGISRRMFLRGLGAAGAIPFLPSLVSSAAAQAADYRRVVFVTWQHGVTKSLWAPQVSGANQVAPGVRSTPIADATLGRYFGGEFGSVKSKLTFLGGLGIASAIGGHFESAALNCTPLADNMGARPGTRPHSVDTLLGRHIYSGRVAVPVLRLKQSGLSGTSSFSYEDFRRPASLSPRDAYSRLYPDGVPNLDGGGPDVSGPSSAERRLGRQRLRIETTVARYRQLLENPSLSAADRLTLEHSLEGYLALQARLAEDIEGETSTPIGNACRALDVSASTDSEAVLRANIEVLTQAFACNATRVATWDMGSDHSDQGAHTANSAGNVRGDGVYTRVMQKNMRHVARLMEAMDAITEGNGQTMLENSLVVVTSNMASSTVPNHAGADAPMLLGGSLGGAFRMGEVIDYRDYDVEIARKSTVAGDPSAGRDIYYGGPPTNELMISIMKEFGLRQSEWGHASGPGFGYYTPRVSSERHYGDVIRAQIDYHSFLDTHLANRAAGSELAYLKR
ncbi:MAG: DUF1552 domain-containing protein [Polyangiales bacterium]